MCVCVIVCLSSPKTSKKKPFLLILITSFTLFQHLSLSPSSSMSFNLLFYNFFAFSLFISSFPFLLFVVFFVTIPPPLFSLPSFLFFLPFEDTLTLLLCYFFSPHFHLFFTSFFSFFCFLSSFLPSLFLFFSSFFISFLPSFLSFVFSPPFFLLFFSSFFSFFCFLSSFLSFLLLSFLFFF